MPAAVETILERLAGLYGWPEPMPHGDPVSELILTILSQNTADTNSGRAFTRLMNTFPSWQAILAAPPGDVADAISIGGLSQVKAPRIQSALRAVFDRSPDGRLDFLDELPLEEARAWLRSLPGVGPKTAACVLLFAFGRAAMPVDTHVERVAKRLGLIAPRTTPEQAHSLLEALVDPALYYEFHLLFIKHGRRTCDARRPRCGACPVESVCPASRLNPERDPSLP